MKLAVAALCALCAPMLAGCTLLSPARIESEKHALSKLPQVPRHSGQAKARTAVLLVSIPTSDPAFDTTQMAYSVRPYQIAYFARNEWLDTPPRMLWPLLVRTLRDTGGFAAVAMPPYTGRFDYALQTRILELEQDFGTEPATLQLRLHVELSDAAGRVIATRDIEVRERMRERTPEAGVVAANDAVANALLQLTAFLLRSAG
jgi:cholesterol transport system auxiliary component